MMFMHGSSGAVDGDLDAVDGPVSPIMLHSALLSLSRSLRSRNTGICVSEKPQRISFINASTIGAPGALVAYHKYIKSIAAKHFSRAAPVDNFETFVAGLIMGDILDATACGRWRHVMELSSSPMTSGSGTTGHVRHRIAGCTMAGPCLRDLRDRFTALSVYFANISELRWWMGIVPVTFLCANFFEWWIHRFVMHRPSQVKRSARSTIAIR